MWVEGEISRFTVHGSGHWYFSLVEGQDTLNCAMFRGFNQSLRWRPRDGERVVCRGGLDVYGPQGKYNLLVRKMDPTGAGARARALEELRRRLAAEGLFAVERKRPIPYLPAAIGVATSPTGAAFQDILKVLSRRFPSVPVYLAPCRVQGEGAAQQIAAAVELLNRHGRAEVLIVGRGGGSIEDLWCFNEEEVVRAVAASRIPVISAVGHEIDTTLCDLVADKRAPTPSAAAEEAVPEQAALLQYVDGQQDRLGSALRTRLSRLEERVRARERVLQTLHPGARLRQQRERLVRADEQLRRRVTQLLDDRKARLDRAAPRLQSAGSSLVGKRRVRFQQALTSLQALSPLRVLERGYSIAELGGRAVTDATTLQEGSVLDLRFSQGRAQARVLRTEP